MRDSVCWPPILAFFNGNEYKATLWFETPNPLLGGIKPKLMIRLGKERKLFEIITAQLRENLAE
jgi:hypothetical protein